MNKEELKKDAEEKAKKRTKGFKCQDNCEKSYVMGALDFAEPREKRIAELQDKLKNLASVAEVRLANWQKLEKENAELKEQNIKDCENFNKTMKETKEQWNKEHYQLTKAKEIIRELLTCARNYPESNKQKMQKAEQFLNSEVEK